MREQLLLDLLNSTPMTDGVTYDALESPEAGLAWLTEHGQPASLDEWRSAVEARGALQDVVRGEQPAADLASYLDGISYRPSAGDDGFGWTLDAPAGRVAAAEAVLAWNELRESHRLRPCANDECRLFLIDHSKANRARWCSMAICGNRMKARRHYDRTRRAATIA
jgi:predicted RNA-binding Zn ribbon-like protein